MNHIIVTFNRSKYLIKCVSSLLATAPNNDMICIWNNASTDDTKQVIDSLAEENENVEAYHSDTNWGCAGGRNRAFDRWVKNAPFSVFSMTDDDYYFNKGWYEECQKALVSQWEQAGFVTLHNDQNPDKSKVVGYRGKLEVRAGITSSQMMMRKDIYEAIGGYKETGKVMGWISSDFCRRLVAIAKFPIRVPCNPSLVENMDHMLNEKNERELYDATGYNQFRYDAKRGKVKVGEGEEYFNGLHKEE